MSKLPAQDTTQQNADQQISGRTHAEQPEDGSKRKKSVNLKPLRHVLTFLWPHRLRLFIAMLALVFTAAAQLSLGYGLKLMIDRGFAQGSDNGMGDAVTFMLIVGVAMAFGASLRFYMVSWLGERVAADLRSAVYGNLIKLHPGFFERNQAGEIMSRLTTDTTLLQSLIGSSVSLAVRNALSMIGALGLMIFTNLKLSLIILVAVPLTLLPIGIFGRRVRKLSKSSQDSIADVGSRAGETLQSIKVVQSYTRESMEAERFNQSVKSAFDVALSRIVQRTFLTAIAITLILSAMIGMLWSGGQDVLNGRMTAGDLGAFVFYAVMVGAAFATLGEVWGEVQRAAGAAERLIELLNETSDVPDTGTKLPSAGADLSLNNVRFAYPSRPQSPALDDLNLHIAAGKTLALVGPSGAGKSTVIELLLRFYDPNEGSVNYGEDSLSTLQLQAWRQRIALVPQNPVLFTGNVHYNIAYGKPDASESAIVAAAKAAHAHEFIERLPQGYDSHLGSSGLQLSGGQRQRIALARAILNDPEILLLDEATSALDSESEYLVQQALTEVMKNRTTVIIAHRLSTVMNADMIAVMEAGHVVDIGTHPELIKRCPLYARLASLQFREDEPA